MWSKLRITGRFGAVDESGGAGPLKDDKATAAPPPRMLAPGFRAARASVALILTAP